MILSALPNHLEFCNSSQQSRLRAWLLSWYLWYRIKWTLWIRYFQDCTDLLTQFLRPDTTSELGLEDESVGYCTIDTIRLEAYTRHWRMQLQRPWRKALGSNMAVTPVLIIRSNSHRIEDKLRTCLWSGVLPDPTNSTFWTKQFLWLVGFRECIADFYLKETYDGLL